MYVVDDPRLKRTIDGLEFPNPVGLAAGFDKDASYAVGMQHLGFGHLELGTVTPLPQGGNPKPRLFRLPKDKALINRMGFNNKGLEAMVSRLQKQRVYVPVGGNIGKNKATPNDEAWSDYEKCFHQLYPVVDYFTINVSSPNTPDLRALQDKEPLRHLLEHIEELNRQKPKKKPVFLKIAPDLNDDQLNDIIEIIINTGISGVIATNTTISREGLLTSESEIRDIGGGGLSGAPVKDRSTEVIQYISQRSKGRFAIIGVGGILTAEDAIEKLEAGAELVQIYTGLIYSGPGLVRSINRALLNK